MYNPLVYNPLVYNSLVYNPLVYKTFFLDNSLIICYGIDIIKIEVKTRNGYTGVTQF